MIKRESYHTTPICELDDGTIVSCSEDRSIMIGDYTIKSAHDRTVNKVIALPNRRIASCSEDKTIKIWKCNMIYSRFVKLLVGHSDSVTSILYIKEKDIMISGSLDRTIRLWNMSTYQCMTVIEEVECIDNNSLYQIDNERVIVGGENSFYIVNIVKCVVEKTIEDGSIGNVNCFIKLRDNKTFLCGYDYGFFCFNDKSEEDITNKNNNMYAIIDLLMIDDNTFLSCSVDMTIKVWKY